ncbi:GNAT family N-acetyltransferase [Xanthomonadaceae bacterium JHOS43]|nr:GNAT family N-acetyltransferase [Xanthomonadaceae bacterium JHOS43]
MVARHPWRPPFVSWPGDVIIAMAQAVLAQMASRTMAGQFDAFMQDNQKAVDAGLDAATRFNPWHQVPHMTLQIREAQPSDVQAICGLLQAVTPLVIPGHATPEAVQFLESFKQAAVAERLASPAYSHWVAERGADFCGYIATRDKSHLYHLFVRPDVHGQGIGRRLWQHLLCVGGPGPYTVNSTVSAVGVYRSFGFVPSGEPQLHRCPPYVPMVYAGDG